MLHSARARLLLALTAIALGTLVLAWVGWLGLQRSEATLARLQTELLPDISTSLTLAERSARLAALAPYVAEAVAPFQLQRESQALYDGIAELQQLATQLQHPEIAPALPPLLQQLAASLDELIRLTKAELFLREDGLQYRFRLQQLEPSHEQRLQQPWLNAFSQQIEPIANLLKAEPEQLLSQWQQRQQRLLVLLEQPGAQPPRLQQLEQIGQALVQLRQQQIQALARKTYLLAALRAQSEQLSARVQEFVSTLQGRILAQQQQLQQSAQRSRQQLLVFSLLSLAALLLGAAISWRLGQRLASVTAAMTALAQGHTHTRIPAIDRRDEIGDLARAFQVFRQNTLQLEATSADLQQQSRLLETIFANINDGLSVFDRQQRLLAWNPQYLSLFKLRPEQLYPGMPLQEVQALINAEPHRNLSLDNQPLNMEEVNQRRLALPQRFERAYGDGRVLEFRSRPMPDGGFVTLYADLSERKAIESQLRQAQKMETLGQLTGGIAHDFNNLLAAIIGNLQVLLGQPQPPRVQRYSERALAAAERGSALVQRLLAFARRQQLQPQRVCLEELIEGLLDLLEYSVGEKVQIQLELSPQPSWIGIDPGQLEHSLLNLALNASAAMPQGGQLRLRSRWQPQQGQAGVLLSVEDQGEGIAPALLERVLEPFFTTKAVGQGSGLGLSMVYGFVKQSGGDLRIHSRYAEANSGTRIDIWLPRLTDSATPPATEWEQPVLPALASRRVLLVEDDAQVRSASEAMLLHLGQEVEAVAQAEQAMARLCQHPPIEILLSDINLGQGRTGIELAQHCQQQHPQVQILLSSGLPLALLRQRYGLPVDTPLLCKPFSLAQLQQALTTLAPPPH